MKLEVELGREQDCNRVQLNETRRELQEMKAALRVTQKEKEQLQTEKNDLMEYICQLEQKMGAVTTLTGAKWSASLLSSVAMDSLSDCEDDPPEALQPLGHYSLCEHGQPEALLPATPPLSPRDTERSAVVINQPAPLCSPLQTSSDALALNSDSEDQSDKVQFLRGTSGEEMALLLPDHADIVLSDLADTALW